MSAVHKTWKSLTAVAIVGMVIKPVIAIGPRGIENPFVVGNPLYLIKVVGKYLANI